MIKVKYNIGSKPHLIELTNYEELGKWIVNNYALIITDIEVNKEGEV